VSASSLREQVQITSPTLYSSKQFKRPAIQRVGYSAWQKNADGTETEFVYVKTPGATKFDWVESAVHKKNLEARKRHDAVYGPGPKVVKKLAEKRRIRRREIEESGFFLHR
jgi:hypothetical protein